MSYRGCKYRIAEAFGRLTGHLAPVYPRFVNRPRIWHGLPARLGRKYASRGLRNSDFLRRTQWLLTLKPGDVINTCTLFNHVIVKPIDVMWQRPSLPAAKHLRSHKGYATLRRGLVVMDVDIDIAGAGGCFGFACGIQPALNHDQLLKHCIAYLRPPDDDYFDAELHDIVARLAAGEKVLDEHLLLIPTKDSSDRTKQAYDLNRKALEEFGKL